jgi:hypothetical protein
VPVVSSTKVSNSLLVPTLELTKVCAGEYILRDGAAEVFERFYIDI